MRSATAADITAEHNARRRALDPLLEDAPELDASAPGCLCAQTAQGSVVAVPHVERVDAASPAAVWGALHRHVLDVRVAGDDPAEPFGAVVDQWLDTIAPDETAGDVEASARIALPSRDIALVNALTERVFAPNGIQAVRLRPRAGSPTAHTLPVSLAGGTVRLATVDDAARLGELDARLLRLDAHFGGVSWRAGADAMFEHAYRERLAAAPDTTWVLERAGEITAFIHLMPHDHWAEPGAVGLSMTGGQYLFVMYLDESERSAGIGTQLCRIAHDAIDAAGAPYTLLSYAVANPRSGPFWARMGYRPLVTEWQRRPAVLAR